jgi:hypothetical protein
MITKLLFFCFAITLSTSIFSITDRYRLSLRDDPATSVVIGWEQDGGSGTTVYYGTTDFGQNWASYPNTHGVDRMVNDMGMDNSFARLTGLTPDTKYYFVIKDSDGVSLRFWFKTVPLGNSQPLSIIAGGDSRVDVNQGPREAANLMVSKLRPDLVMYGGDHSIFNTGGEWQGWLDDWQLTIAADGKMSPVFWERGNHELSAGTVINMFDIPETEDEYYAISIGGTFIRLYTLNTEISVAGNQKIWLENDLITNHQTHDWNLAQYHSCMKPHTTDKTNRDDVYSAWAQLFHQYRVQLIIESDAHDIKTTWPIKPSTGANSDDGFELDTISGSVYIGEGCWGAPLRTADWNKTWTRDSDSFNGFNWLKIGKDTIEIRTVQTDNSSTVASVSDNDKFTLPAGINIWNPSNGDVVYILNQKFIDRPAVAVTYPYHQQHFASPQSVTITATASDILGTVSDVKFFVNDVLIGNDATAPYSLNWAMPANGDYTITAWAIDNEGWHNVSDDVKIYSGDVDITVPLLSNDDDAEEYVDNGNVDLTSTDLELCIEEWSWPLSDEQQWVGLRFANIDIPSGATITDAFVQFTADENQSSSSAINIHGEAADNSSAFTSSNGNISSRAKTSTTLPWPAANWIQDQAGPDERTPNLIPIVQEIINRPGWQSGNALSILFEGTGTRSAYARDEDVSKSAKLILKYSYVTPLALEVIEESTFEVFPNPANEFIMISPKGNEAYDLKIYSLSGALIREEKQLIGQQKIQLTDSIFVPGVYIFNIDNISKKVIIK